MIASIHFISKTKCRKVRLAEVKKYLALEGVTWIDIESPSAKDKEFLAKTFSFDELILEDAVNFNQRPKLEERKDFLFLIFTALIQEKKGVQAREINFFLGKNYFITVHKNGLNAIEAIKKSCQTNPKLIEGKPAILLYRILDKVVDDFFPVLDAIDDVLDAFEAQLFKVGGKLNLNEIMVVKRQLLNLRKIASPEREILLLLSSRSIPFIPEKTILYFRDIFDHLIRVNEMIEIYRDLVTTSLDVYLSVVSNRTNEIMKVLTIFAAIMLPLSVIAGIYGMNFWHMPELRHPLGYYGALGLMAVVVVVMLAFFRRKGWI